LFRDSQQGHNYGNYEALQSAVRQQLQRKGRNLHWADTHPLVQTWKTDVDRDGDYNKNSCTFNSDVVKVCEMITWKTYSRVIIIIIIIIIIKLEQALIMESLTGKRGTFFKNIE